MSKVQQPARTPFGDHLWKGLAIAATLLLLKVAFEYTPWSHHLESATNRFLQDHVLSNPKAIPKVVLLDISQLDGGFEDPKQPGHYIATSREQLRALLKALDPIQPKAIGIDIDFSPTPEGLVDKFEDPKFFEECLQMSRKIPIKLGIYRTIREAPEGWLGVKTFESLAAAIWLPKADQSRLPVWVADAQNPRAARVPSMGAALATAAYRNTSVSPSTWFLDSAVERKLMATRSTEDLVIADRIIDRSFNEKMLTESIKHATPESVIANSAILRESIVIIGDVNSKREHFGDARDPLSRTGLIFHGATAQTLAADDLYEFTFQARLLLDALVSLATVFLCSYFLRRRNVQDADTAIRYEFLAVLAATVLVAVSATVLLLSPLRVLWLDLVVVFTLLLLHLLLAMAWGHRGRRTPLPPSAPSAKRPAEGEML